MDPTSFTFTSTTGYKNGLFGCLADPLVCCGFFCGCGGCLVGWAAGANHGTSFDVGSCLCPAGSYRLRRDVQKKFGIQESEAASMCATGLPCIGALAAIQDVAEMRARGELKQPAGVPQMSAQ